MIYLKFYAISQRYCAGAIITHHRISNCSKTRQLVFNYEHVSIVKCEKSKVKNNINFMYKFLGFIGHSDLFMTGCYFVLSVCICCFYIHLPTGSPWGVCYLRGTGWLRTASCQPPTVFSGLPSPDFGLRSNSLLPSGLFCLLPAANC